MRRITSLLNKLKRHRIGFCYPINIVIEIMRIFTLRFDADDAGDCCCDCMDCCCSDGCCCCCGSSKPKKTVKEELAEEVVEEAADRFCDSCG